MPRSEFKKMAAVTPTVDPGSVDVTSEYDVFKRMSGNRTVSETHVKNLMNAMLKHDLMVPILVNQDFEVIDGQHRLEARKRLGLPVPYYWQKDLGLIDVQTLNSSQKGWVNDDFMRAYIELGNQHYVQYEWFRRRFGLPHVPSVWLLSGSDFRNSTKHFRQGEFRVHDLEGAKAKATMLTELAPHFSHWKDAAFIKAFLVCLNRVGFDFKTFLHRVSQNPTMLKPCKTIDAYLQIIEEVYNYRAVNKVPIRFAPNKEKTRRLAA